MNRQPLILTLMEVRATMDEYRLVVRRSECGAVISSMAVWVWVRCLSETDQNPKLHSPGIGAGLADVQGNRKKFMKHYKVPGDII